MVSLYACCNRLNMLFRIHNDLVDNFRNKFIECSDSKIHSRQKLYTNQPMMSTGTNYSQESLKEYNTLPTRVAEIGSFEDLMSTRDYKQRTNIKLNQVNSFNWKWMDLTVHSRFSVTHICSLYTVRSGLNVLVQNPMKCLCEGNLS